MKAGQLIETPHGGLVFLLHDGLLEPAAKALVGRQIAWHQEGEDAPQLAQPVLHRRTGEGEPHPTAHFADGLVFLGGVVLDGLRLVEDAGVKLLPS